VPDNIKQVTVITSNPSGNDLGSCEVGFYTLEGDLLTMVDGDGVPMRNANTGEKITHRLASGESEKTIAKRLTLKIFNAARGDEIAGFNRPIHYPKCGGV